jgi:hypothetical protein
MPSRTLFTRTLIVVLAAALQAGVPAQARVPGPPAGVPVGPPGTVPVGPPGTVPVGPPGTVPVGPPGTVPVGPPANVPPGPPATVPVGPPVQAPPVAPPGRTPTVDGKATLNLVHGIPGVSATVCVNGDVALPTFDYEDIATVRLDPAEYLIEVVPPMPAAIVGAPCAGTPVLDLANVQLDAGTNYSVVAHLDETGVQELTLFENDTSPAPPGTSRVVLHHLAHAPAVFATIGRFTPSALDVATDPFANGDPALVVQPRVRPGNWAIRLFDDASEALVLGPETVQLRPRTAYFVYAVGAASGSMKLLVLPVALAGR